MTGPAQASTPEASTAEPIRRVGFVGVGQMGWPMAARLVRAGFAVTAADAGPGRAAAFAAETGAAAADDLAALAAASDAVITMLPSSTQVTEVLTAMGPALRPGTLVAEMSSGQPAATRALAAGLAGRGVALIDAPVSGGVGRARTGELTMMCGGADTDLDRAAPMLAAMGPVTFRCGGTGAGQAMKALNNLVSAGGLIMTIEALLIGHEAGLDPGVMTDVLNASTGMTNSSRAKIRQFVLSGQFSSGFGLDLMVKDLGIATDLGRAGHLATPLSALCAQLWQAAATDLGPGQDHTGIARFCEHLAGVTISDPDGSTA